MGSERWEENQQERKSVEPRRYQRRQRPSHKRVYAMGILVVIGVMVAASAGVVYQRKTTAALVNLIKEISYLREAEVYDSDTTSTADDGDTASAGDFNMHERMFLFCKRFLIREFLGKIRGASHRPRMLCWIVVPWGVDGC